MDRLFLDANVLFSAAYRADSGLLVFWRRLEVELVSSTYATHEARRNLPTRGQVARLEELLTDVGLVPDVVLPEAVASSVDLPEKDRPILAGALAAGATHLITGDVRHFGRYFGTRLHGVRVLTPARYLREAEPG